MDNEQNFKKLEIKPSKKKMFGRKLPPTQSRPPAPPVRKTPKKYHNEEYEELLESSNRFNLAVHDYIEKYGMDEKLMMQLESKFLWMKMFAKNNSLELE